MTGQKLKVLDYVLIFTYVVGSAIVVLPRAIPAISQFLAKNASPVVGSESRSLKALGDRLTPK